MAASLHFLTLLLFTTALVLPCLVRGSTSPPPPWRRQRNHLSFDRERRAISKPRSESPSWRIPRFRPINSNYKNRVGLFGTRKKARNNRDPWDNTGMGMVSYASKDNTQNSKRMGGENPRSSSSSSQRKGGMSMGSGSIEWGFHDVIDMHDMVYPMAAKQARSSSNKMTSITSTSTSRPISGRIRNEELRDMNRKMRAWSHGLAFHIMSKRRNRK